MRIGEFAKKFDVSIDTIRHYMDLGLIIPTKSGAQYSFDDECIFEMENIVELKKLGFTLTEIKSYQFYMRISKLKPMQNDIFFMDFIKSKKNEILKEIDELSEKEKLLSQKLDSHSIEVTKRTIGIPLNIIDIFACPLCKKDLVLNSTEIINNQVMSGTLDCSCGESLSIHQGIICEEGKAIDLTQEEEEESKMFFVDYVNKTNTEYFNAIHSNFEWIKKKTDYSKFSGIACEVGSGVGLFLRNIYDSLPDDMVYICVDNNHQINLFLKQILELDGSNKNVIFITSDMLSIPLKDGSIDVLIDAYGTTNYISENESMKFPIHEIDDLLAEDYYFIGSFFLFRSFSTSNTSIEEGKREAFMEEYITSRLKRSMDIVDTYSSENLPIGGEYEMLIGEGDKAYIYSVIGER